MTAGGNSWSRAVRDVNTGIEGNMINKYCLISPLTLFLFILNSELKMFTLLRIKSPDFFVNEAKAFKTSV